MSGREDWKNKSWMWTLVALVVMFKESVTHPQYTQQLSLFLFVHTPSIIFPSFFYWNIVQLYYFSMTCAMRVDRIVTYLQQTCHVFPRTKNNRNENCLHPKERRVFSNASLIHDRRNQAAVQDALLFFLICIFLIYPIKSHNRGFVHLL